MLVRRFQAEDNPVLARLFSETIRAVNSADYSAEQVSVWAGAVLDLDGWRRQVEGRTVYVTEESSELIGFNSFEPDGHLDHLYVHRRFQRQGVASALLREIEKPENLQGVRRIFTEASITARPFFEHAGFRMIAAQTVVFRGVSFLNYRMEKLL